MSIWRPKTSGEQEEIRDFDELTFWWVETQHIHKSMRSFKIGKDVIKIV